MRSSLCILCLVAACQDGSFFVCNDNADCDGGGLCESVGACSFPDDACESGRRFGEASAPSVAGMCVEEEAGTTTASTSTSTGTTASTSTPTTANPTVDPDDDSSSSEASTTSGTAPCPSDWWDCAWGHRVRISFAAAPAEPLDAFPVLVLLGASRIDYAQIQPDAEDLRFVSASGDAFAFEIETWDPTGVSAVWVLLDELGPTTDPFYLYYDNPIPEPGQDPAAVWPAPHMAVFHFTDSTGDSTANANFANAVGGITFVGGQIGQAADFGDTMHRIDVEPHDSLADIFVGGGTISAWMRPWGWGEGGNGFGRIVHRDPGTGAGFQFYVLVGALAFSHRGASTNTIWSTLPDSLSLDRWTHVAAVYDAGSGVPAQLYVDGVEQTLTDPIVPPTALPPSDANLPLAIGNRMQDDRQFEGRLDEIRFQHASRSAEWIRMEHLSGRDEVLVYDPPEAVP